MDRIYVTGLRAEGIHGVLPEERVSPQPFAVDIEIRAHLAEASRSDRLDQTIDYGQIALAARRIVEDESYQLLEALATRIADVVNHEPRVRSVAVTVRKLKPPIEGEIESVGVCIDTEPDR